MQYLTDRHYLELVKIPLDVEPIGRDHVRLPLDKMFGLFPRDVGHGREHMGQVAGGALYAVPKRKIYRRENIELK